MQSPRKLNDNNFVAFANAYREGLKLAVETHPSDYGWAATGNPLEIQERVDVVSAKMLAAVEFGEYNHDGRGFKNACKIVGIKHTRSAIEAFITAR